MDPAAPRALTLLKLLPPLSPSQGLQRLSSLTHRSLASESEALKMTKICLLFFLKKYIYISVEVVLFFLYFKLT